MQHDHADQDDAEPSAIQNRRDAGGPWSTAWPLIALIGLILVRACVPAPPAAPSAPASSTAPGPR